MLLSICEFSDNECTERCILHKVITQLCLPPPILIKFSTDVHKTLLTHPIMSFIKIGTVTAILYLGMGMNFMWVKFNLRVLHINAIDHLIVL
jgi:hypothetical protein